MFDIAKHPRFVRYAFVALLGLAAAVFMINLKIWSHLPIYSDEISYRFFVTRAFFDDWRRISLFPTCLASAYPPMPVVFYPAAFVFGLYSYIQDMQLYRYFGEAVFLGTFTFGALAAARFVKAENRLMVSVLVMATMALFVGVLPSLLVELRPEHIIYLSFVFAIWAALRETRMAAWIAISVMLVFFSMAIYAHPKAVYFAPGIAAVLAIHLKRHRLVLLAAWALLAAIVISGIRLDTEQFLTCPESPGLEQGIANQNINPTLAFHDPSGFLHQIYAWDFHGRHWSSIIKKMTFQAVYDGGGSTGYLPAANTQRPLLHPLNDVVMVSEGLMLVLTLGLFALNLRVLARAWVNGRGARWDAFLDTDRAAFPLLLVLLFAAVFVHLILNRNQVFYDIGCWLILFTVFNVLSLAYLGTRQPEILTPALLKRVVLPMLAAPVLAAVLSTGYSFATINRAFEKKIPVLGVKVKDYDRQAMSDHIHTALRQCRLDDHMPHLVHDDFTYPYIQAGYYPVSVSWLYAVEREETAVLDWLRDFHSPGIVMYCDSLRSAFHFPDDRIGQAGDVCCINLQDTEPVSR